MGTETVEDRFNMFYKQHSSSLFLYAKGVLNDDGLAEEIVQDVFLIAWKKYEALLQSSNPGGWLMNTLKYTIKNFYRLSNEQIYPALPLEEAIYVMDEDRNRDPSATLADDELFEVCKQFLSQTDYLILHKAVFEGYTCVEIANSIGYKKNTCQKKLQRVLTRLKNSEELQQFLGKL